MKIEFHPDVVKQLQGLPRRAFAATLTTIIDLAHSPRPPGVKKLAGSRSDWRVRIGEHRIIYEIDDSAKTVTVLRVEHRWDAYR